MHQGTGPCAEDVLTADVRQRYRRGWRGMRPRRGGQLDVLRHINVQAASWRVVRPTLGSVLHGDVSIRTLDTGLPAVQGQYVRHRGDVQRDVSHMPRGQDAAQWAVVRRQWTCVRQRTLHERRPTMSYRRRQPWSSTGVSPGPAELPDLLPGPQKSPAVHRT